MEKVVEAKFLMFKNKKNNCWLDACVALVAHNETLKEIVKSAPKSQINKIITAYDDAVSILNDPKNDVKERLKRAKEILVELQASTQYYLKPFLKQKVGEPDSAFCAVLNLIRHDVSTIKEQLSVEYVCEKYCTKCGAYSIAVLRDKQILTLHKVDRFEPTSLTSIFMCSCKNEQEMKLFYRHLPPCLLFQFENGAGNTDFPLVFSLKEREYQLTAVVILEKSNDPKVNHFVTWIRNPLVNMWLDCNDLNTDLGSFSCKKPKCNIKDVYMYVFESFDNLGKIPHETPFDQDLDDENANVQIFDISSEKSEEELENATFPKNLHVGNETNLDADQGKRDIKSATATTKSLLTGKEIEEQIIAHTVKKETEDSSIIDYRNDPASISTPDSKNAKLTGLFEHAYESEFSRCVKGEHENDKKDGKRSINNVSTDIKLEKDEESCMSFGGSEDFVAEVTTKPIKQDHSIKTSKREMLNETQQASSNTELGATASETVTQNSSSRKKRKCNKKGKPKVNDKEEERARNDELELEILIEEGVNCAYAAFIEQFCQIKNYEENNKD